MIIKVNQPSNSVDTLNTFDFFLHIDLLNGLNPMDMQSDMQSDIQSVDDNLNLIEVFGRKP